MRNVPAQVCNIEEAVSLREKSVAAASCSLATTTTSPLEEDTDGPNPALWSLANFQGTPGLRDRVDASLRSCLPLSNSAMGSRAAALESADGGKRHGEVGCEGRGEWPRRVRLRTRLGKRCRKDLAAGRAGILIKSTFNPLEGDSSGAKARKSKEAQKVASTWLARLLCTSKSERELSASNVVEPHGPPPPSQNRMLVSSDFFQGVWRSIRRVQHKGSAPQTNLFLLFTRTVWLVAKTASFPCICLTCTGTGRC